MSFGNSPKGAQRLATTLWAALLLAFAPQAAMAQAAPPAPVETAAATETVAGPATDAAAAPATDAASSAAATGDSSYTPLGPEHIKGQPTAKGWDVQQQYSPIGHQANQLHIGLIWVMAIISAFVLGLLLWVVIRFNKKANPTPSKTTHNTLIEVVWTVVPVLILVAIAIPSIDLLAKQYETPPKDAVTVKAIGYQWYWGYEYPDNGGFEVVSNMMPEDEAEAKGFPGQLEVDNRMVVPVKTPIRLQTTAADVIHSFAVPSLWFKLDAVPGRINEKLLYIEEPGIYYGQCSELCGIKHGYMPIAVEALPRDRWEAWVRSKGGTVQGDAPAAAPAAAAPAAAATPAAAETPAAAAPAAAE
ncbi:cytochrome c oxidase subunit II [Parerythrobacter lacustris]|uniref:Cytochrome c oxidase subunit 2 n=1 Tax=Parerythrobacter lacustris TaxID=2969984 RepID=A0ABT1XTX1_9SPHN|nr:cytochrome c oxidase subunit II [Parerythrobacter lacustris]MCR2835104.1 cytochrome c oxidase subunit II [Parerythrobacter lacustris]